MEVLFKELDRINRTYILAKKHTFQGEVLREEKGVLEDLKTLGFIDYNAVTEKHLDEEIILSISDLKLTENGFKKIIG